MSDNDRASRRFDRINFGTLVILILTLVVTSIISSSTLKLARDEMQLNRQLFLNEIGTEISFDIEKMTLQHVPKEILLLIKVVNSSPYSVESFGFSINYSLVKKYDGYRNTIKYIKRPNILSYQSDDFFEFRTNTIISETQSELVLDSLRNLEFINGLLEDVDFMESYLNRGFISIYSETIFEIKLSGVEQRIFKTRKEFIPIRLKNF